MSLIDPLSCGFAKIAYFNIFQDRCNLTKQADEDKKVFKTRLFQARYQKFVDYFNDNAYFHVDYKKFIDKFPAIVENIHSLGKRKVDIKEELLTLFSKEKWKELPQHKKNEHSLFDCNGCLSNSDYKSGLSKFPVKHKPYKLKAQKAGLFNEPLKDLTNTRIQELDKEFKSKFQLTFSSQLEKENKERIQNQKKIAIKEKTNLIKKLMKILKIIGKKHQ